MLAMPTPTSGRRRGHGRGRTGPVRSALVALVLTASLVGSRPAGAAPASAGGGRVLPEVPVTPVDERLQLGHNSPLLAADPTRPDVVVLASRLDNPDFGCALHVSGDGGRGWVPVRPVPKLPPGGEKCYAPEVAFDRDGVLYYLFVALQGSGNNPIGAYLVTSSDRGRTFSRPRQVLGPGRYMVRMAIDQDMGRRGRLHLVWLQVGEETPLGGLPSSPNPLMAAYSDDGGRTFSPPVRVSDGDRQRVVAPALALGPDHRVHVLYYDLGEDARDYQGLEGPTWEGTWSLVVTGSSDGGRTFGPAVVVDDKVVPPERVMLIYTMPPPALAVDRSGRLFAAWCDARSGDWDVLLRRSVDGGRTWTGARRLNDDPVGNGRNQYLPRLSVSPNGRLDAVFYDRRQDPRNRRNHVYLTSSTDGGRTFGSNRRLTSESSDSQIGTRYPIPSALGLVELGSRIGLLSERSRAVAAWTDTRNFEEETYEQDILATEARLSGPARSWAGPAAVAGGVLALALLAAVGLGLRRRAGTRPDA
jgi:hypothetical protein